MNELVITSNSQVTLHFSLTLNDGSVVDSTFDKQPATFVMGDGSLLPGFEKLLLGLQSGDKKSFVIKPEQGFGMPNPNNVQSFKRSQFAEDMPLKPGVIISFADAGKAELPGMVKEIFDDTVVVDFNHPLAGRDIQFQVEIIAIAQIDG